MRLILALLFSGCTWLARRSDPPCPKCPAGQVVTLNHWGGCACKRTKP